jgi:outer membrane protein assembly factor BamB
MDSPSLPQAADGHDSLYEATERRTIGSSTRYRLFPAMALLVLSLLVLAGCTGGGSPQGWPSGAVVDDTLFIGTQDGDFRALSIATGETLWSFRLRGEDEDLRAIYGAPAVSGDALYFAGYDGLLYALTLEGDEIWDTTVGESDTIVGGPVVADGMVLIGSSDGNMYAYDVESGSLEWTFPTDNGIWTTATVSNGIAYFGSLDNNIYAVTVTSGNEVWRFPAGGAVTAKPVVADGKVYVGAFNSVFYALDAATGQAAWRFDGANKWYWGGAIYHEGAIYAPSLDGNVYALDSATGDLMWTLESDGPVIGSPAVVGDRLASTSMDGRVRLVKLSGGQDERPCNIGEDLRASLTVNENTIYVAGDDHSIRALNIKSNGNPDETWVHFTDSDIPVPLDSTKVC